ncbi:hypothetical protein [Primorskyibacter sedentarius]|uniref:hypothetical protein n=1 Tax=Primorskyibacter sedentarius TaxID=745311 RepID=UPI003EBCEE71
MARIRSIKPEFWTSEQIVECSRDARLMFIGLWNFCDDNGIHPASARRIKMEIFPADDIDTSMIRRMLDELLANKLIRVYVVDDVQYIQVTGWAKHQKIDRPTYKYPQPIDDTDAETQLPLVEHSTSDHPRNGMEWSGYGEEKEREERTSALPDSQPDEKPTRPTRGTRLKLESLPDDWQAFARKERPDIDARNEFATFRDYWIAQPGQKGVKVDWDATWRNWVRRCNGTPRTPQQRQATRQPDDYYMPDGKVNPRYSSL